MIPTRTAQVTLPADEQILITREFDAPAHLLYRAHTEPELVRRWWAGRRGTVTLVEIDLRVGGRWRYVMEAEGGSEVGFHGEYREIVPDERIVLTEVYEGAPATGEPAVSTYSFEESGGRTRLSILMQVGSKAERDAILGTGMETGVQEQMVLLDALAQELAAPLVTGVDFVTIPARDIEESVHFYGTVLGLPERKRWGSMPGVEFQAGNLTLAIMEPTAFGSEFHPHRLPIALHVADVAAAYEQLRAAGVEFITEVFDSGVCHQAICRDPAGNTIGLHHRYAPGG